MPETDQKPKNAKELDKLLDELRGHPINRGHVICLTGEVRSYDPNNVLDDDEIWSDLTREAQDAIYDLGSVFSSRLGRTR